MRGERLTARITGRVQGVGFRWWVRRHADGLGLTGWVMNDQRRARRRARRRGCRRCARRAGAAHPAGTARSAGRGGRAAPRAGERGVRRVRNRSAVSWRAIGCGTLAAGVFVLVALIAIWRAGPPPGCPSQLEDPDGAYEPIGVGALQPEPRGRRRRSRTGLPDDGRVLVVDGVGRPGRCALGQRGTAARRDGARVRRRDVPGLPPEPRVTRRPILLLVNPSRRGQAGLRTRLWHDDPERLRPDALASALRDRGLEVELHELARGRRCRARSPAGGGRRARRGRRRRRRDGLGRRRGAARPSRRHPRHPGAGQLQQHRSRLRRPGHPRRRARR